MEEKKRSIPVYSAWHTKCTYARALTYIYILTVIFRVDLLCTVCFVRLKFIANLRLRE